MKIIIEGDCAHEEKEAVALLIQKLFEFKGETCSVIGKKSITFQTINPKHYITIKRVFKKKESINV